MKLALLIYKIPDTVRIENYIRWEILNEDVYVNVWIYFCLMVYKGEVFVKWRSLDSQ